MACPFTEKDGHMRGEAKVRFNCELWIMNYEEFCGICWRTQIQVQFTIYKVQVIGWCVRRWDEYSLRRLYVDAFIRWRVETTMRWCVKMGRLRYDGYCDGYSVCGDRLMRWFVERLIRWVQGQRSKVKGWRAKVQSSRFQAISHRQQPLPLRDMLSWPNKIASRVKQDSFSG